MPTFKRFTTDSTVVQADEKKPETASNSWFTIPSLITDIRADLSLIGTALEPLSRNWMPLLEPTQKLINYLNEQLTVMSDPDNPDPGWKKVSTEALAAIEKVRPILDDFSKGKTQVPLLLAHVETLLSHLPKLITYFDEKLIHDMVSTKIPRGTELDGDLLDLVMGRLAMYVPDYKSYLTSLETVYNRFTTMSSLAEFSKRSYIEKLLILVAMEEFNNVLEKAFLMLDYISIILGLKEDYLLNYGLFMDKKVSIDKLCQDFNKYHSDALHAAGFKHDHKESMYPFMNKILIQQKNMLKAVAKESTLNQRVAALTNRTINDIIDHTKKTLVKPVEKKKNIDANYTIFLQKYLGLMEQYKEKDDIIAVKLVEQECRVEISTSAKNSQFLTAVNGIVEEMNKSIEQMCLKEKISQSYMQIRIAKTKAKLPPVEDDVEEIEEKVVAPVAASEKPYDQLRSVVMNIMSEAKELNEIFANPARSDVAAPVINPALENEPAIDKALKIIDTQLAVMLQSGIYKKYILGREVNSIFFNGNGWIATTGNALSEVKQLYAKYKELKVYFTEQKVIAESELSPKEQMLVFMNKTRDLAEISKQLIKSGMGLLRDPVIGSLLTGAGITELFGLQIAVAAAPVDEEKEEPVVPQSDDTILNLLRSIAKIYKKAAEKHLLMGIDIESTQNNITESYRLIRAFQDFQTEKQNRISMSNAQKFAFVWKNYTAISALINDISYNIASLRSASNSEFSLLINQLNTSLKSYILMFDRIEIEFNLQNGFFTRTALQDMFSDDLRRMLKIENLPEMVRKSSLHDLITNLYGRLDYFNYTFAEKYPFTKPLLAQQQVVHRDAPLGSLKSNFARFAVVKSILNLNAEVNEADRKEKERELEFVNIYRAKIRDMIAKLNGEVSANAIILKSLLQRIESAPIMPFNEVLNEFAQDPARREEIYLLYQRHCKGLMNTLHIQTAKRQDLLNEIDLSISKLTDQRAQRYFFYAKERRTELEDTIYAFNELRKLLERPGYKVTDFAVESPRQYYILTLHHKGFLEKLLDMSEQSYYLKDEKVIAGDVFPRVPVMSKAKTMVLPILQKRIIAARLDELKQPRMFANTSKKKIILLEALQDKLQTLSFEKALNAVHDDVNHKGNFYLLHEGKTGRMIQEISQLHLSRNDIAAKIALEIVRLKQRRSETVFFFEKSRKIAIEQRILACQALLDAASAVPPMVGNKPQYLSWYEMLAALTPGQRYLLNKHESKLLKELKDCEKTDLKHNMVLLPPVQNLAHPH